MKNNFLVLALLLSFSSFGQIFSSFNIGLISLISPNTSTVASPVGNKYSGCWGWFQQSKNKEYAISGASNGTYFIDISSPASPSVSAFVPGKQGCTWRELKTYQNYCYIVSDDATPNAFQIVDMQYLPDSVHVVHSGTMYFERAHTIWIDGNRMYLGGVTYPATFGSTPMAIYSLATPTNPALIKKLDEDIPNAVIDYVHDMYARNDTIYASCGDKGLHILKLDQANDTLYEIGNYKGYAFAGYSHSSFMTQNGKYLMICDEVPGALPIHLVDIQNLGNIQPLTSFRPYPNTTPHNPYIIGNKYAIVSSYQDGLMIFDISQPTKINLAGYFDTFPQGGANTGDYGGGPYNGNWGAYPFLPSKLIIANDMQNGLFVLDATSSFTTNLINPVNPVGIKKEESSNETFIFYPNPADHQLALYYNGSGTSVLSIKNMLGQIMLQKEYAGKISESIDVSDLTNGTYVISIQNETKHLTKKLLIHH